MGSEERNDEDQECCEEVSNGQGIDKPMVDYYRDLMVECYDAASVVIEQTELVDFAEIPAHLRTRIALPIFDRVTRQMPAQDKVFGLALEYVGFLLKEKEAEAKRSEELRDRMSDMPRYGEFKAAVPPCLHAPLRAMREALLCEGELSPEGHKAIDALSVKRPGYLPPPGAPADDPDGYRDMLLCPGCLGYVEVGKLKSGEVWAEEEVSSDEEMTNEKEESSEID